MGPEEGVEVVTDRGFAWDVLARKIGADPFLVSADTEAVFLDLSTPNQPVIKRASPEALEKQSFAAASMGPTIAVGGQLAQLTDKTVAIGKLADLDPVVAGSKGTSTSTDAIGVTFHE